MFSRKRAYPFAGDQQDLIDIFPPNAGASSQQLWLPAPSQQPILPFHRQQDKSVANLVPPTFPSYTQDTRLFPTYSESRPQNISQRVEDGSGNQHVCFGALLDITAQLRLQPQLSHGYTFPSSQCFEICRYGGFYALEWSGARFAVLSKRVCECMHRLLEPHDFNVQLRAFVPREEWFRAVDSWQLEGTPDRLTFELNIYGPRELAQRAGKILSGVDLHLQWPQYGLDGFVYYNPHYLHLEEVLGRQVLETPLATSQHGLPAKGGKPWDDAEQQNVSETAEIDRILNSLSHHNILKRPSIDQRIRTIPKDHQAEAVDFIFRRETGNMPPEKTLWRKKQDVTSDTDETLYRHILTGAQSLEPKDSRGGILADDMGLGKSLVILSIVAGCLDRANAFSLGTTNEGATPLIRAKSTLVIAPSSLLLDTWIQEIRDHTNLGSLTFYKHHGQGRNDDERRKELLKSDIVLSTYATVAADIRQGNGIFTRIIWFRVVLDEAHEIRNRSTKQCQAIVSIQAMHRWCLTGTPIQNSVEDLGALVSFLHLPILQNATTFRKYVATPSASESRERFRNLRLLLQSICLRRTKELLRLPETLEEIRWVEFSTSERQEYDNIHLQCRRKIDIVVSGHKKERVNCILLESLLKLRLYCNNGTPKDQSISALPSNFNRDPDETPSYLQQDDDTSCAFCSGPIYSMGDPEEPDGGVLLFGCTHRACRDCIWRYHAEETRCPVCSPGSAEGHTPFLIPAANLLSEHENVTSALINTRYPSKLLAFLEDISAQQSQKSIVFSSWKKTLDLISELLESRGIQFSCIHGSLPINKRLSTLKDFREQSDAKVLLMTLGTGAVGLNLAVATRIYLMEPQWNPSIELQAVGRAHRLGQQDQVTIVRYIMKGTVEDSNVLPRQKGKLQLASGGFEKRKRGIGNDTLQSLRGYFGVHPYDIVEAER
ncbi:SNF2 family N-terminal domain-containing protein [Lasiosphaeris hirsuta]|uniref:SNF2 family N-terminal domain-containing protein n=1 Tax=Lasiosphaeris hirsuta TaxID=260670 RepID=A0AA39ZPP2_9PEZI|nr:SNF2 family N-terminal domain-containing protein [Lasiosphaeris hirsuta]